MPATAPVNIIAFVVEPLQSVWLLIEFTDGVGFTEMVKTEGVPGQPFATGVTVTVAV